MKNKKLLFVIIEVGIDVSRVALKTAVVAGGATILAAAIKDIIKNKNRKKSN